MISTTGNLLNNVAGAVYFLNGNSVLQFRATLVTLCEMHPTMKKVMEEKLVSSCHINTIRLKG